jgi:CRP/FNR family transcriptional regulator, cyclic AMP receptor protein
MLSALEKMLFLKGVSFFQDMTVDQLKAVASVCEEELFVEDTIIFNEGDPGGTLYIVVSGKVSLEQSHKTSGKSVRIQLLDMRACFGEDTLFDNSPMATSAKAIQDTLTLQLRHEPLTLLMQQQLDIALQFLKVLSERIQTIDEQSADLSRRRSRQMHKVFDRLSDFS